MQDKNEEMHSGMAMVSEAHVPLQNALGLSAATMRIIHQSAPGAGEKASKDDKGLRGAIATLQNIVSDLAKRIFPLNLVIVLTHE